MQSTISETRYVIAVADLAAAAKFYHDRIMFETPA